MTTDHDPRRQTDCETNAALVAGLLAAILVIGLTVMALVALSPAGAQMSAISAALAG